MTVPDRLILYPRPQKQADGTSLVPGSWPPRRRMDWAGERDPDTCVAYPLMSATG